MRLVPDLRTTGALCRSVALAFIAIGQISIAQAQTYHLIRHFGLFEDATGSAPLWPLIQGPDGALYGTTSGGALTLKGSVFKVRPDGTGFAVLKLFTTPAEGLAPNTSLVLDGNMLYGTTSTGGETNAGTLFKVNIDGNGFAVLASLPYAPGGELALSSGKIFGTASNQVFSVDLDGNGYTVLHSSLGDSFLSGVVLDGDYLWGTVLSTVPVPDSGHIFRIKTDGTDYGTFTIDCVTEGIQTVCGRNPNHAGPLLYDNKVFVPTYNGGVQGIGTSGTIYARSLNGSAFDNGFFSKYLHLFDPTNSLPDAGLTRVGTDLFGTTTSDDSIYRVGVNGQNFSVLKTFSGGTNGAGVTGRLLALGNTLYGVTIRGGRYDGGTVYKVNTDGSDFGTLAHLNGAADGNTFHSKLASDGTFLYGTTYLGGASNNGTIFRLRADGTGYTPLKSFFGYDGQNPEGGLVLAGNTLYGTTYYGGNSNSGVIFRINSDGSGYTVLTNLVLATGASPYGSLVSDGNFLYGTTSTGGVQNAGVVFRISQDGTDYKVLKDFMETDGQAPFAGLLLTNGTVYGTTFRGGSNHFGTVFKLNTDGSGYTVLKHFNQTDGSYPRSALMLRDNTLFGTTSQGGLNNLGEIFHIDTDGANFTVMRQFTAVDGYNPYTGVVLIGSTLYGTTFSGGASDGGTFYQINPDGRQFSVLSNVVVTTGLHPQGELLLQDGLIYGTTSVGGEASGGVIFAINPTGASISVSLEQPGNQVVLTWTAPGYRLQSAPSVTGVYIDVPEAQSPYPVSPTERARFFRLILNTN